MSRQLRSMVLLGVALMVAWSISVRGAVQTAAPPDTMTALLSEVHALRLAMERSATVAPRVQLTVARLNIEEQRIAQLSAQLDQARRQLTEAAARSRTLSDNLADNERTALVRTDETERRQLAYEQREIKRAMAAHAVIEQQLRARESDASQLLAAEQSRWIDLNARLDELDRLLGPIRQQP